MPRIIFKKGLKIHHGAYQMPKPVINEVDTIGEGIKNMQLPTPPTFDKSKFDITVKKPIKRKNIKIII